MQEELDNTSIKCYNCKRPSSTCICSYISPFQTKTRSGKIMRRILRKIAGGEINELGDISTLLNPEVVAEVIEGRL